MGKVAGSDGAEKDGKTTGTRKTILEQREQPRKILNKINKKK